MRMDDLLLHYLFEKVAAKLIEEHIRADVLRAHGYEPRHRVLLSGPPGNGKTSFAEAHRWRRFPSRFSSFDMMR